MANKKNEINYTHDVTDTVSFAPELRLIHQRRDQACCDWLQEHAFHPAKCLLIKMAHRLSARRTGWQHSIFKFDHSVRDAEGKRKRTRECMAQDSRVPAPQLFEPTVVRELVAAELKDKEGISVNHVQLGGGGAEMRDFDAGSLLCIEIDSAWQGHVGALLHLELNLIPIGSWSPWMVQDSHMQRVV